MNLKTVGSVCSGIEAASVAWKPIGLEFEWFSEIAEFPSKVLKKHYPNTPNLGDMELIPDKILNEEIIAPDIICGGTPCQAFSLAGWKNGLNDDRGNLTLKFVDIIEANDYIRAKNNDSSTIVFWENVEGVLKDKTNAFGCFISSLAGLDEALEVKKWSNAGILHGPKRNVAWRILDAKYFGLPQQRKRLYVLAGGKDFYPEKVLFEKFENEIEDFPKFDLSFEVKGYEFETFREYTDCLYAAYGTKWNGNAAANNGSLFVVQNQRIRRLSPLETERLMGFPDDYTNIKGAKRTGRYQATGNSWAVPVVNWIGTRLLDYNTLEVIDYSQNEFFSNANLLLFENGKSEINSYLINTSMSPNYPKFESLANFIEPYESEDLFISPVGCFGMIRRKRERNLRMNPQLEKVLLRISHQMPPEEIEKRSRVQKRGKFSSEVSNKNSVEQLALF